MNKSIERWLIKNNINYESFKFHGTEELGIFIPVSSKERVIKYLTKIKRIKEWKYRANYTFVSIELK